jgi:nucleoside-diphosphate-sugar epimerase
MSDTSTTSTTSTAVDLTGAKVLVTGATGQVGHGVAARLARRSDVWAIARFTDPRVREQLESAGVRCITVDLEAADFSDVPHDVDYVLDFAVAKTNDFDRDLRANGEALGLLMRHTAAARAFLHCSSTAVYEPNDHRAFVETDPLGDNHRPFGFMPTYSIAKISAEVVARYAARAYELPTTIARLSVPYGDDFGWPLFHLALMRAGRAIPVHTNAPSVYNPIHLDDIVDSLGALLGAAAVPATIVNWAGHDPVSIEDWCGHLGSLTGLTPQFAPTTATIESVVCDTTKYESIAGPTRVAWRDGLTRMVAAQTP